MNAAVVLGEIDLVSALGRAGIPCAVSAVRGDPALYSRHARWTLPWVDTARDPDTMSAILERFARAQPHPPVLYYNGDADLLYASRHRGVLQKWLRIVLPDADLVEKLVHKVRWQRLAEELGLPVPRAVLVEADRHDLDESPTWPQLVKPALGRDAVWRDRFGGRKAIVVESGARLEELRRQIPDRALLVQELVPGPETEVHSYHVYVDGGGKVVADFTGRKIRTFPLQFGETSALSVGLDPEVAAMGREMVAALGLRGVAKFDYKRAPDGRWFLLEINARFTLWHNAGATAGINIPAIVHADLTGTRRPKLSTVASARWCHPTNDFRAVRAQRASIPRWVRWALSCDARWALEWRDPMPFARGVVVKKLRRIMSTSRRRNALR